MSFKNVKLPQTKPDFVQSLLEVDSGYGYLRSERRTADWVRSCYDLPPFRVVTVGTRKGLFVLRSNAKRKNMQDLDRQFPGMRFRIIDEQDQIRPHVKIFVNREQVRGLDVALKATDDIAIVPAFSGG